MSAIHQSAPLDLSPTINTRLLKLELDSSAITLSFIISVRLHVTSLVDAPPYTAVSYVWGKPSPTKPILLDGQFFTVRQNLWDLLNQLRAVEFDGYFWVDALSIDQTSNSEKNHQVAIMGSIYRQAKKTIAWLDIASVEVAEQIHAFRADFEKLMELIFLPRQPSAQVQLRKLGLKHILSHPYWTRTWILQEYLLSSSVEFWFRNKVMTSPELMYKACMLMIVAPDLLETNTDANILTMVIDKTIFGNMNFNLIGLLSRSFKSACVDPRDRIYALLSLLSPRERELWGITPDYAASAQDLFEYLCGVFEDTNIDVQRGRYDFEGWKSELRRILLQDAVEEGRVDEKNTFRVEVN